MTRKLIIIGHARHGKDSVAQHLAQKLGLSYRGSSEVCADWIFQIMKKDYNYKNSTECFKDRVNYRTLWGMLIAAYTANDKARLGRLILKDNDIYCGVRRQDELDAVMKEFDCLVLWVDASKRHPLESKKSMQLKFDPERYEYIDNNGSYEELLEQL